MSFIPALISAVGGAGNAASIVGGVASVAQGVAANKQAQFQASVNEQQAARERQVSAAEEEDFRRRQSRVFAKGRAEAGASGIDIGTGSSLLAAGDFAAETELQALRIRSGGATRATRLRQKAQLTRQAGRSNQLTGFLRGGASLLTGFSTFKTPSLGSAVGTDLFIDSP